ncbi:hypothetical protein HanIR_Chr17g0897281 [Helianthus annuus]|nr:hypothetical protein HanIR_Chr17g0897281 [Helianthus annuus]
MNYDSNELIHFAISSLNSLIELVRTVMLKGLQLEEGYGVKYGEQWLVRNGDNGLQWVTVCDDG